MSKANSICYAKAYVVLETFICSSKKGQFQYVGTRISLRECVNSHGYLGLERIPSVVVQQLHLSQKLECQQASS